MPYQWKWTTKLLISTLAGAVMSLSWNFSIGLPFLFGVFALLLLLVENSQQHVWKSMCVVVYPFIVMWNISVLWWVWYSTIAGCIAMIVCNTLLLSIPWILYLNIRKRSSVALSLLVWASSLLSIEYMHYNWEGNFPWLTLGNAFSVFPAGVQWISYTGVAGISIWVLLVNILLYFLCTSNIKKKKRYTLGILSVSLICLPVLGSLLWVHTNDSYRNPKTEPRQDFVIVQPNIDSYVEKFTLPADIQIDKMLSLSMPREHMQDSSSVVWVWPETAIPNPIHPKDIQSSYHFAPIFYQLTSQARMELITGAVTVSQDTMGGDVFYNSVLFLHKHEAHIVHHKSKLVPGSESVPFHRYFSFLDKFSIDMGGTSGSLGTDTSIIIAQTKKGTKIGTIICYESIFGDFVRTFVKRGADIICLVTNDSWWGNTPGYKQHLAYGKLRAIENRRYMVRSANTGVSCFINPYGEIIQQIDYEKQGSLYASIPIEKSLTLYTLWGDYLYTIASICLGISMLAILVACFLKRLSHKKK